MTAGLAPNACSQLGRSHERPAAISARNAPPSSRREQVERAAHRPRLDERAVAQRGLDVAGPGRPLPDADRQLRARRDLSLDAAQPPDDVGDRWVADRLEQLTAQAPGQHLRPRDRRDGDRSGQASGHPADEPLPHRRVPVPGEERRRAPVRPAVGRERRAPSAAGRADHDERVRADRRRRPRRPVAE